jgi:hypothetical protein
MQQGPSWEANMPSASQEIPPFYVTRWFITALTSARHLSLLCGRPIQSMPPHYTSWRSALILSSIYAWVFQVDFFLQVSPSTHLSPPQLRFRQFRLKPTVLYPYLWICCLLVR